MLPAMPPVAPVPLSGSIRRDRSHLRWVGSLFWLTAAVVILALALLDRVGLCTWGYVCGPLMADDLTQGRIDTALPAPQGPLYIEQTFTPRRDGLSEIQLLLVRYGGQPTDDVAAADDSRFTVELWDEHGARLAGQSLPAHDLTHNQRFTLSFPPLSDSAGRRLALRLRGTETNHIAAWAYSLDIDDGGDLSLVAGPLSAAPPTPARELYFVTRYALTGGDALAAAVAPLAFEGWLMLTALLFLPLPGALLLRLFRLRVWDGAAWLGTALALGVAAWPILWFWLTLAGGRWTGTTLWIVVIAGWLIVGVTSKEKRDTSEERSELVARRSSLVSRISSLVSRHAPLILLLLLSLATRFIAVRDLAFPPWVDASRHGLITAVMTASGQTPSDYAPYLPVEGFPYHFGFHTLSAGLALMTGRPLPGLLLTLGQMLNGLLPLAVYAAAWHVTRRRDVAWLAAFLVALPFFFPGYYATWGRMTQLAAMVVMPVLVSLTWRLGRGWPRLWPLVGVLAAGLFLIHFRVFLFYLPFAALAFVAYLPRRRWLPLVKGGTLALLLVLPRLVALLAATDPLATLGQSQPGYNDFPIGYVTTGWERLYLALAGAGALILIIATARRRRWVTFPLLLLAWVAVLFGLLAGERLGLPETLVVNLNSMYITLFLPLALFLSIVGGRVWRWVEVWLRTTDDHRQPAAEGEPETTDGRPPAAGTVPETPDGRPLTTASRQSPAGGQQPAVVGRSALVWPWSVVLGLSSVISGLALGLLALFGARQQANILNPQTILALPEDTAALAWMAANLPSDARVAVNAWQWLGETWAGSDGGAWLTPLTGLEATTPPVDHIYNAALFAQVRAFNAAAAAVEDWGDPAAAAWLRQQGVTHVFLGRRGGFIDPAQLSRNPDLSLLFQRDGTFVFQVASAE